MSITITRKTKSKPAAKPRLAASSASAALNYGDVFRATHGERFTILENGLRANLLFSTINDLGISQERAFEVLRLPRSSMLRIKKTAPQRVLERDEGTLVLGLRRMIGQVEAMVEESGETEGFKAAKWLAVWLETPNPALNGRLPAEFMHQTEGQELVSQLLGQMQSGAYA